MYEVDEYPRVTWRRRFKVLPLALVTSLGIAFLILFPQGGVKHQAPPPPPPPADKAACKAGQQDGCVGGRVLVIVPAAGPAASR